MRARRLAGVGLLVGCGGLALWLAWPRGAAGHEGDGSGRLPAGAVVSQVARDTTFFHADHDAVACVSCHDDRDSHGALSIRVPADCVGCHHEPSRAEPCSTCHGEELPGDLKVSWSPDFSTGPTGTRLLPFDHGIHSSSECAACHVRPEVVPMAQVDCSACHGDHHEAGVSCLGCHDATVPEHDLDAHLGCTGSGCHATQPVELSPWSRSACLVCHAEQVEHRPAMEECSGCHAVEPIGTR